jgi:hypothetical protein
VLIRVTLCSIFYSLQFSTMKLKLLLVIVALGIVSETNGQKSLPFNMIKKCMQNEKFKFINFNFVSDDITSDESLQFLLTNFQDNGENFFSNEW